MITVLQSDGENNPDVLAGVGASAALVTSTIPWNGPIASVRVCRIDNKFLINPTRIDVENSDIEMIVSGNKETVVMVEGEAKGAEESEILEALKEAHTVIKEIIEMQIELAEKLNIVKDNFEIIEPNSEIVKSIDKIVGNKIKETVQITDKLERNKSKDILLSEVLETLSDTYPDDTKEINSIIDDTFKILGSIMISLISVVFLPSLR
jgi:polyribonucleotide nucleotidyltransferase